MPQLLGLTTDAALDTASMDFTEIMAIADATPENKVLCIYQIQGLQEVNAGDWGYCAPHVDSAAILGATAQSGGMTVENNVGATEFFGGGFAWAENIGVQVAVGHDQDSTADMNGRNLALLAIDIEDIQGDSAQYVEATDITVRSATVEDETLLQLTVTANEVDEEWLIIASQSSDMNSADLIDLRLELNGGGVLTRSLNGAETSGNIQVYSSMVPYIWKAPDTAATTFDLIVNFNSATSNHWATTLIAVRLKSLSTNFATFGNDGGLTTYEIVAADTEELITGAEAGFTPSGANDVVLIGWASYDGDVANEGATIYWTDDDNTGSLPSDHTKSTDLSEAQSSTMYPGITAMASVTTPSGAQNYELWVLADNAAGSMHYGIGVAMEMDGGDGGFVGGSPGGGGSSGGGNRRGGGGDGGGGGKKGGGKPGPPAPGVNTRVSGGTWF